MRAPLAVDSEQLVRHDAGQHDRTKWHYHGNQERNRGLHLSLMGLFVTSLTGIAYRLS